MSSHGFFIYGMWGPITDPGARTMTERMAAELPGINMHASPYRDYDVNTIVDIILKLPAGAPVLVAGTSLGANNTPIVAAYVHARDPQRIIHGIWGFQASIWGAKAGVEPYYTGIPPNVLFAQLTTSDNPIPLPGLGAYRWIKSPGNNVTNYYNPTVNDPHPGDGNVLVQNQYIAEMKRVITVAQGTDK